MDWSGRTTISLSSGAPRRTARFASLSHGPTGSRSNLSPSLQTLTLGFELVLDAVGKTRRAGEVQRHCPMQTDAQQPIEPDKMIHVGVRHEDMADAKELPGRQRGQIAESE